MADGSPDTLRAIADEGDPAYRRDLREAATQWESDRSRLEEVEKAAGSLAEGIHADGTWCEFALPAGQAAACTVRCRHIAEYVLRWLGLSNTQEPSP